VSEQLLSNEAVEERLRSDEMRAALRQQVSSLRQGVMGRRLQELLPGAANGSSRVVDLLRPVLRSLLKRILGSRGFIYALRAGVEHAVGALAKRKLDDLVSADAMATLIADTLLPVLRQPEFQGRIQAAATEWLSREATDRSPSWLGILDDEGVEAAVAAALREAMPTLTDHAFGWLSQPDTRVELEQRGRTIVRDILDKLSLVQKMFVTAGQYERTLTERMPEIIGDILTQAEETVRGDAVVDRIVTAALGALRQLGGGDSRDSRDAGDGGALVASAVSLEAVRALIPGLLERIAEVPAARVSEWATQFLQHNGGQTLAQLAGRYLRLSERDVSELISNQLLELLGRDEVGDQLADFFPDLIAHGSSNVSAPGLTLAEMVPLEPQTAELLDEWLTDRLLDALADRVPQLLGTLDVEALVVARVDSLAIEDVERLLVTVIARHLKWINVFGALIGALIGVMQLVLRALPAV
jgi:uncharacterized membrane protein YheB (UPF0754 family)